MSKILVLIAMATTALMSASSASATVWNSNGSAGGTGFTATAPASKLVLTGIAAGMNCTTTSATGVLYGPSGTVGVNKVADLTPAFNACRAGGFTMNVSCRTNALAWWVTGYTAPVVSGSLNASMTPLCTMTVPSISGCTINVSPTNGVNSGVVNVSYDDTTARMTIAASGQALTATWSSCGTLFGSASGSARGTYTDSTGASLVYSITSTFRPNVTLTTLPPPPTTWNSNGSAGGTSFTTTAPASELSVGAGAIDCTTTSASGVLYGPTGTVGVDRVGDLTPAFSGCTAGGRTATMSCTTTASTWWITNYAAPVASGTINAGANPICTVTVPSVTGCLINLVSTSGVGTRVFNDDYNNTAATITVPLTGQALTAQWSSCGTLFGSATGSTASTLSDSTGAALVYTISSAFRPNVTA
jgi:hypothetical protein